MRVLAFDLGASSGRGILATLQDGKITLEEIHRFANNGVNVRGTLYWDRVNQGDSELFVKKIFK